MLLRRSSSRLARISTICSSASTSKRAYGLRPPLGWSDACDAFISSSSARFAVTSSIFESRSLSSSSSSSRPFTTIGLSMSSIAESTKRLNASAFLAHSSRCASSAFCWSSPAWSCAPPAASRVPVASRSCCIASTCALAARTEVWMHVDPGSCPSPATWIASFSSLSWYCRHASSYSSWRVTAAWNAATLGSTDKALSTYDAVSSFHCDAAISCAPTAAASTSWRCKPESSTPRNVSKPSSFAEVSAHLALMASMLSELGGYHAGRPSAWSLAVRKAKALSTSDFSAALFGFSIVLYSSSSSRINATVFSSPSAGRASNVTLCLMVQSTKDWALSTADCLSASLLRSTFRARTTRRPAISALRMCAKAFHTKVRYVMMDFSSGRMLRSARSSTSSRRGIWRCVSATAKAVSKTSVGLCPRSESKSMRSGRCLCTSAANANPLCHEPVKSVTETPS
mmetsp:Transcript_24375/g.79564  ORF Transcript_24375/g.79564 Transcript_24375/m.79564 type:complete len:456 (+) Transcript_24375:1622-2989(+)